jgi:hypothetical protein
MTEGQNIKNTFSSKQYSGKSLDNKVPLYALFQSLDDTLYEVFSK